MASTAVKYNYITRDTEGTPFADRIKFWSEEPVLNNGVWNTPNGCDNSEDANLWVLWTALEFEYGTCLKNVQITTSWKDQK